MRKQDFKKLVKYLSEKQNESIELQKIVFFFVSVKNDPKECRFHVSDENYSKDFTFFEHDDYSNSKFEIDSAIKEIFSLC